MNHQGCPAPEEASEDAREFAYQEYRSGIFCGTHQHIAQDRTGNLSRLWRSVQGGYVKLNQGYFEDAVTLLSQALDVDSSSGGFIRLELASAHLNLGNDSEGCSLLEGFLKDFPESLRAYPPLCEIYWQNKQFDEAQRLLMNCPETLRNSPLIHLLMGETLFHAVGIMMLNPITGATSILMVGMRRLF